MSKIQYFKEGDTVKVISTLKQLQQIGIGIYFTEGVKHLLENNFIITKVELYREYPYQINFPEGDGYFLRAFDLKLIH